MNQEFKGLGGIQEYQKLANSFSGSEVYLNMLLRADHASLTELASFLIPGGLFDTWSSLKPRQRQAFLERVLRKNLRVAAVALSCSDNVKLTLAAPAVQRVLAVEIIRTFSGSRNQEPINAIEELRGAMKYRADVSVDPRFV